MPNLDIVYYRYTVFKVSTWVGTFYVTSYTLLTLITIKSLLFAFV